MNKNVRHALDDLKTATVAGTISATIAALVGAALPIIGLVGGGLFIAVMLFPPDREDGD